MPDERKVHHAAIPRLGGISFLPSMLLAAVIMLLALAGIVSARKYLRSHRALQILCTVFCIFLALACAVYIGLTVLLVDAVRNRPPSP